MSVAEIDKPLKKLEVLLNEGSARLDSMQYEIDQAEDYLHRAKMSAGELRQMILSIRSLSTELHSVLGPDDATALMDAIVLIAEQWKSKQSENGQAATDLTASEIVSKEKKAEPHPDVLEIVVPEKARISAATGLEINWLGGWGVMDDDGCYYKTTDECREDHVDEDYVTSLPGWLSGPLKDKKYLLKPYPEGDTWSAKLKSLGISVSAVNLVYSSGS